MALREAEYSTNTYILKEVGPVLKVVFFPAVRNAGIEKPDRKKKSCPESIRKTDNQRLAESISRSKRLIYENTLCNDWDFFFTGTIDKDKFDRYDIKAFHKAVTQWIRDYNKKHRCKISFLLVPELHADGAVHLHGFLAGIPENEIRQFRIGDIMGKKLAEKVLAGEKVYNWPAYQNKFGYCSLEPIKSKTKVAKYIEKYITKELALAVAGQDQCFWHSRGLKKPVPICKGRISVPLPFSFDYVGEHASVAEFPNTPEKRDSLISLFDDDAIVAINYIKGKDATV